jgi:hypothetical protein
VVGLDTGANGDAAGAVGLDTGEAGGEVGAGGATGGGFSVGMLTVRFSSWVGWEIDVIFSRSIVAGKPLTLSLFVEHRSNCDN